MTFHSRYVDPGTLQVHSQLVQLIEIDASDCSAKKIFNAFYLVMQRLQIPFQNIVAMSCDNASVMTGKHESFKKKLENMNKNVLILTCPCHSAALVALAACKKIPDICEEFIRKIAFYINSSPKRTAIFREFCESFQESNHKILKLSQTSWLCRHACVQRILEYWDTIEKFLTEIVMSEKTPSGQDLLCLMKNVNVKAYLLFLKYILEFFNSFNKFFQKGEETRIQFLYSQSIIFLTKICDNFLKSEVLKHLPNVTFSQHDNQKCLKEIFLGLECEEYLNQLMVTEDINVVTNIREHCLEFYVTAAEEICKKLPVNDKFLSALKVFLPQIALNDTDRNASFSYISFVSRTMGGFDEISLKNEWFSLHLDFTETEKQNLSELNFDNMWIKILQSKNNIGEIKYPNLTALVNTVRSLPNSNADSERIFSCLTDVKTKKRNNLSSASVNVICVIKSAKNKRRKL